MPNWSDILQDKFLAIYGFAGSLVSTIFLSPPRYVWGIAGLFVAGGSFGLYLQNRFVESNPNEWLLVINDGKLKKAGVGLKTFIGLTDTFVKFPSKVEQVEFTANNVTKEMQGVVITGFAFWSVYRDEDGPFRCYKYMEGGDANRNVQAMCESVLRSLIANSTLDEVLRNRNHLKDSIKNELKDQLKGWGIWLETVEITEVKISSERLFKDLQAEFRQETQLKAQQIELASQEKMNEVRQVSDLKITEGNELNETKKQTTRNNERIKRDRQQADYDNQKSELELKKIQRESAFEIQKMGKLLEQEQERIKNDQLVAKLKQDFEFEFASKKLQLDKEHDEKTLLKYQIDSTERIYSKLGIKEIKINQFTGDSKTSLGALLPQMGFAMGQLGTSTQ